MSGFLWAPPSLRSVFADAMIGERCSKKCPPRLVVETVRGLAWISACGFGVTGAQHGGSVVYRLGPIADIPSAAQRLKRASIGLALREALETAVPLEDPMRWGISTDVRIATRLGAVRWGVTYAGSTPAAVGFDRDGCAVALIAFTKAGWLRYETGQP